MICLVRPAAVSSFMFLLPSGWMSRKSRETDYLIIRDSKNKQAPSTMPCKDGSGGLTRAATDEWRWRVRSALAPSLFVVSPYQLLVLIPCLVVQELIHEHGWFTTPTRLRTMCPHEAEVSRYLYFSEVFIVWSSANVPHGHYCLPKILLLHTSKDVSIDVYFDRQIDWGAPTCTWSKVHESAMKNTPPIPVMDS